MCTPGTATCAAVPLWPSPHPNACPNVLPVSTRRVPRYFFDRYHPQCLTNTFPLHLCSPGIPTVLVMTFALGKDDPSIALLLVILGVSLTSTGPIQPFIATLFMGQSLTDEDKGFYSGMLRSTQALGKALGSAIVGAAIGGPWIESWKKALDDSGDLRSSAAHTDYWLVPVCGYLLPLVLSYGCFLLGESCCLEGDKRGWESKDAWQGQDLYINCCSPGGLVVYQTGYKEKKAVKLVEAKRRASSNAGSAGP